MTETHCSHPSTPTGDISSSYVVIYLFLFSLSFLSTAASCCHCLCVTVQSFHILFILFFYSFHKSCSYYIHLHPDIQTPHCFNTVYIQALIYCTLFCIHCFLLVGRMLCVCARDAMYSSPGINVLTDSVHHLFYTGSALTSQVQCVPVNGPGRHDVWFTFPCCTVQTITVGRFSVFTAGNYT